MKKTQPGLSQRQQKIYDFLRANPVGVLSTVGPGGDPHGAVIYFDVKQDFLVFFLTRAATRKYDNIKHHTMVTLTVFDAHSQTAAQISGRAAEVTAKAQINAIADDLLKNAIGLSGHPVSLPIAAMDGGPYTAFKIKPTHIRLASYKQAETGDQAIFESIESFDWEPS